MPWLIVSLLLIPLSLYAATYHVSKSGNDSAPCGQGARQSINAGIACLQPGDTLVIGGGTYAELVANVRTAHTTPLPQGTTLQTNGRVVLRPGRTTFPGGGGVITLTEAARGITLRGLNVDAQGGHTNGVMLQGTDLTFTGAEVTGARKQGIAAQKGTRQTITHNRIYKNGTDTRFDHGLYICGQDKVIADNVVHDNAAYGINVACETGGIRRITVRQNLVYANRVRGIHVQGKDNLVEHNTLQDNGIGIGIGGGGGTVVQHNTISGYSALADNYGILAQTREVTIRGNHLSGQRGTTGYIAWTEGQPTLADNRCDQAGAGCQSVGGVQRGVGAQGAPSAPAPTAGANADPAPAGLLPTPPTLPAVPTPPPAPQRVEG